MPVARRSRFHGILAWGSARRCECGALLSGPRL